MSSKYAKLTKAELLILVDQVEAELTEAKSHTLKGKVDNFIIELKYLGKDLQALATFIYNAGVTARQELSGLKLLKN